jgi:hypothetical protein
MGMLNRLLGLAGGEVMPADPTSDKPPGAKNWVNGAYAVDTSKFPPKPHEDLVKGCQCKRCITRRKKALEEKRGNNKPLLLTPERMQTIKEKIEAGAYPWVATVSTGVNKKTYYNWLAHPGEPYESFRAMVEEAEATARHSAEIRVHQAKPDLWLQKGPGKDKPNEPGWTDQQTVQIQGTIDVVSHTKLDLSALTEEELVLLERITSKLVGPEATAGYLSAGSPGPEGERRDRDPEDDNGISDAELIEDDEDGTDEGDRSYGDVESDYPGKSSPKPL